MKGAITTGLIYIIGGTFLFLGVLGLVLPLLQGILFIVIGLALLSLRWPWLRRKKIAFLRRYPRLERQYTAFRGKARVFYRKLPLTPNS